MTVLRCTRARLKRAHRDGEGNRFVCKVGAWFPKVVASNLLGPRLVFVQQQSYYWGGLAQNYVTYIDSLQLYETEHVISNLERCRSITNY